MATKGDEEGFYQSIFFSNRPSTTYNYQVQRFNFSLRTHVYSYDKGNFLFLTKS